MPCVNTIYYIKNGKVIEVFDLEMVQDKQQKKLEEFIERLSDSHE